jgi:hypothetical protein
MAIGTAAAIALGVGALGSAAIGASAASKAGKAQVAAADKGVEEQRAAREEMRRLLEPYVAAGGPALEAQMGALGLRGTEAQQAYVAEQEQSPIFQALKRQQEESILQNASATGGLRGGNIQGALAQFSPALLNQFLTQQYDRLGGMTALGQQSAAGVGTSGMQSANAISNLFGQAGAARAGAALGVGQALSGPFNLLSTLGGMSASKSMGYAPPVQPRGF